MYDHQSQVLVWQLFCHLGEYLSNLEEQYQSEQRQFRAGTSTLFLVQQRQTDMIAARSQERRAESDLGKAIATFELATGTILQTNNIRLR